MRLHDHLARPLHADGAQVEREDLVAAECAHAAVKVARLAAEEQPRDEGEHRIADVFVERRHRAGLDPAREAIAHHQIVPRAQRVDERIDGGEVVRVIRIRHEDIGTARGIDAAHERGAVALRAYVDDARTRRARDLARTVGGAVVGDDDLAVDAKTRKRGHALTHDVADRRLLVETGDDDREFEVVGHAHATPRSFRDAGTAAARTRRPKTRSGIFVGTGS